MLIDSTYFVGKLLIPNLSGSDIAAQGNVAEVNRFIAEYEPEFLRALLGGAMFDSFQSAILAGELTEPWLSLKNKLIDSANKLSPIAGYVYYWYQRNNVTQTSGIGEVQPKAENGVTGTNNDKMIRAWNKMSADADLIALWVYDYQLLYPEFAALNNKSFGRLNAFNI